MANREETLAYGDGYWEEQVKRSQALASRHGGIDWEGVLFWGMCLFAGLAILFGPTVLAMAGLI